MKRLLHPLIILIFSFYTINLSASHIIGGEITYSNEGNGVDTFDIYLKLYVPCDGTSVGAVTNITVSSSCTTYTLPAYLIETKDITPVCSSMPSTGCNNPSGTSNPTSVKTLVYVTSDWFGFHPCSDFTVSYIECCRSGSVTNINNPTSAGIYISATFKKTSTLNRSPLFKSLNYTGFVNQQVTLNFGGIDPDIDSLFYELIAPHTSANAVVGYNAGYSNSSPLGFGVPINLNSQTGLMSFTPTQVQVAVIGVKVSKYRWGLKIGEFIKEININIVPSSNNYPTISGIDNTSADTIIAYANSLVEFDVYGSQGMQDLTMTFADSIPGSTFTIVNPTINNAIGTFKWTPDTFNIRPYPYYITIKVEDDLCQLRGSVYKNFFIQVEDPNSPVWPGDANNDLIANNTDLLTLGLAYGSTGPLRPGASINWIAQPATNWLTFLPNNLNTKYSDTNGDGIVDANDTLAIIQNYGLTHNRSGNSDNSNLVDPVLYIDMPDSAEVGETVLAPIFLGDVALPVDSIYGIAFTILYDQNLVEPSTATVDFNPSWIGTAGVTTISIKKDFHSNGFIDAAVTRIDQNNVAGFGQIGTFSYVVPDDIAGKTTGKAKAMTVTIGNIHAISKNGDLIEFVGSSDSLVVFDNALSVKEDKKEQIKIYPNPINDFLIIDLGSHIAQSLILMDISGKQLVNISENKTGKVNLQLFDLQSGIYILQIKTPEGQSSYKIHKP